ncbi:MAG TPA: SRPBCC family protein [Vicinamibacterales bacterium]|nr:SRPBCC family protein [Vicinamibacterales bacterium]
MTRAEGPWAHTHKSVLPATPGRVFAALTTARELRRWFAEDVEISAQNGGMVRFWGRHVYGAPPPGADQRITRFEPGRAFAFQWPFEGLATEVVVTLEPGDAGEDGSPRTQLVLQHRFPAALAVDHPGELVDDLWRLTIGNLDAYLRGGEGIVLPDYSDPAPEIRASIVIDAPRARVFQALLDPAALNQWVAIAAVVEPRVGGRYTYGWDYQQDGKDVVGGPTRILELVENEWLVTDWPDWRGDPTKRPTRVMWQLESLSDEKTRVTVIHGTFPRVVDFGDYPFGWRSFLEQLKTLLEQDLFKKA